MYKYPVTIYEKSHKPNRIYDENTKPNRTFSGYNCIIFKQEVRTGQEVRGASSNRSNFPIFDIFVENNKF